MQRVMPSSFRKGLVLVLDASTFMIEDFHHTGTAKTRHKMHVRMRNLHNDRIVERSFSENEEVASVDVGHKTFQFSFRQGSDYVFMDADSFDEIKLTVEQIGERHVFLRENEEYKALYVDGKFLSIQLPDHVALKVEQTAPPQRASQQSALKPATMEGGLEVLVPMFITTGEVIKVDTRDRKYLGKEAKV